MKSPYACYLKHSENDDTWEWDLTQLERYEYCQGLYNLGVKVIFEVDHGRLRERSITTQETGICLPQEMVGNLPKNWPSVPYPTTCRLSGIGTGCI